MLKKQKPSVYLERATRELVKLPGLGSRSASRIAFHLLNLPSSEVEELIRTISDLKNNIVRCSVCGGISDSDVCPLCTDSSRNSDMICVVEDARDIFAIEGASVFNGVYHVLGGLISPLDGIGPDEINVKGLIERCRNSKPQEIIFALNSTIEGEATTLYVSDILETLGVRVTRIAQGLPVGSDLEFVDGATIARSIEGRVRI